MVIFLVNLLSERSNFYLQRSEAAESRYPKLSFLSGKQPNQPVAEPEKHRATDIESGHAEKSPGLVTQAGAVFTPIFG